MITRVLLFLLFLFYSCSGKIKETAQQENDSKLLYAGAFSIHHKNGSCIEMEVHNVSKNHISGGNKYLLLHKNIRNQSYVEGYTLIPTPVKRIVCLSTTHIAFISLLGKASTIVGISGKNLVCNPEIRERIDSGWVKDVGYDQNLNYELILSLKPDLVTAYSVDNDNAGYLNKIKELGIPVVMIAEYLEQHPLGKAEWLKFFGALYEEENYANELFDSIKDEYLLWKGKADSIKHKPLVMTGLLWNNSWFVPAGDSYLSKLIHDAGGEYLWKNYRSGFSYPLSFEKILTDGQLADVWINPGSANNRSEIIALSPLLAKLPPFVNNRIYNNNLRQIKDGGNDYWESGVVNPHMVLADLFCIFHPEFCEKREWIYYKRME